KIWIKDKEIPINSLILRDSKIVRDYQIRSKAIPYLVIDESLLE
ncbi:434_t:CDS:2, partial [Funneliformis geosporum]